MKDAFKLFYKAQKELFVVFIFFFQLVKNLAQYLFFWLNILFLVSSFSSKKVQAS